MLLQTESLPEIQAKSLSAWLERGEFNLLITILKSKAFALDVQSITERHKSEGGLFPDYEAKSKASSASAEKYLTTIQILKDLSDGKLKLETHRAVPE